MARPPTMPASFLNVSPSVFVFSFRLLTSVPALLASVPTPAMFPESLPIWPTASPALFAASAISSMASAAESMELAAVFPKEDIPLCAPERELLTVCWKFWAVCAASPTDWVNPLIDCAADPTDRVMEEENLSTPVPEKALSMAFPTSCMFLDAVCAACPIVRSFEDTWSFRLRVVFMSDIRVFLLSGFYVPNVCIVTTWKSSGSRQRAGNEPVGRADRVISADLFRCDVEDALLGAHVEPFYDPDAVLLPHDMCPHPVRRVALQIIIDSSKD